MNCKKTFTIIALLIAFNIYANAQMETNAEVIVDDPPEALLKSTFELFDKGFGDNIEVPEYNPAIVDESDALQLYWSVYPNPTNSNFVLWGKNLDSLKSEVQITYRLYDANGNILLDEKVEAERTGVGIEFLSPSVYYLSVLTEKSIKSFKIIKY